MLLKKYKKKETMREETEVIYNSELSIDKISYDDFHFLRTLNQGEKSKVVLV